MPNQLEELKKHTLVVADTGDFNSIKKFFPTDATTNPSLILQAMLLPEYQHIIDAVVQKVKLMDLNKDEKVQEALDRLTVAFGVEITKIIPGRVSTEVDPRLSYSAEKTVQKALKLIDLYKEQAVDKDRILIKICTTWEGVQACKILEEQHGVHCNMTLVFNLAQAVACAEARATLISPFVGRILDWFKANTKETDFEREKDPGVISVKKIYQYFKKFGHGTIVMGASFRSIDEIRELAGIDALTISPKLLAELEASQEPLPVKLNVVQAKNSSIEKIDVCEENFRWELSLDRMTTQKLTEGITAFHNDTNKVRESLAAKLQ